MDLHSGEKTAGIESQYDAEILTDIIDGGCLARFVVEFTSNLEEFAGTVCR